MKKTQMKLLLNNEDLQVTVSKSDKDDADINLVFKNINTISSSLLTIDTPVGYTSQTRLQISSSSGYTIGDVLTIIEKDDPSLQEESDFNQF